MTIDIKVPVLPESVADASIAKWHVSEGERVGRDQNIVDIETDKVVLEVVSPEEGVITQILDAEGDTVLGEQTIAKLEKGNGATAGTGKAAAPAQQTTTSEKVKQWK